MPWRAVLKGLDDTTAEKFVDWLAIDRIGGRDLDLGYYRSYIDPTEPFAETILKPSHGVVITSATLRDNFEDEEIGKQQICEQGHIISSYRQHEYI